MCNLFCSTIIPIIQSPTSLWSLLHNSAITSTFTFIVINIAFILHLKNKKTRLLFVLFTISLLIIPIAPSPHRTFMELELWITPLLFAISIEGFTFSKIFGMTKWIHTILSCGILLGTIILCLMTYSIRLLLISFVLVDGSFSLLLWYANKQEHFLSRKRN